ncbi:oxidoreductase [Tersicoccus solisilvae]|uniref:Oxidoreductase n=1 Tax=Tersicoccus solisilvae TaxID=1882339 RepID=A0ABQ1P8E2_9MICC|nr:Gfo/Idh/MocA family oxidoreductase [Tersicoccus solisilvae]GGC93217.1 oxidoreductase [Tersicoccus solisilvae]
MTRLFPAPPSLAADAPAPLTATGRPLRWGIVSTGSIAATMAGELALLEDAVLHAVASRSQDSADAFASEHGIARAYGGADDLTGLERMAADPDVDVAYIGSPHSEHAADAELLLQAGKHVLCEKAFTVTAAQARRLADVARANDRFLMEAVWTRFQPGPNRLWDLIADGAVGQVRWLAADLAFAADQPPQHRLWNRELAGGALLDLGPYTTLWPLTILGRPVSVTATGTLTEAGVDAQEALTLVYPDGVHAQLTNALNSFGPRHLTVGGTEGWLRAGPSVTRITELTLQRGAGEPTHERFDRDPAGSRGYVWQLREVTRCIQQGLAESPTMPLADSVASMELFDAVRAQLGVRYPADDDA